MDQIRPAGSILPPLSVPKSKDNAERQVIVIATQSGTAGACCSARISAPRKNCRARSLRRSNPSAGFGRCRCGFFYSARDIGYRSFRDRRASSLPAASDPHFMKFAAALALLFNAMFAAGADVQPPASLRVVTFNGGWDLPIWAAQRQGFFEANGVAVQLSYTPSSEVLVTGLFDGRFDIALASIDNFIAYQEGQGEARLPAEPDLFSFIGGDGGFLSIVASPAVKSFADLKGKTLSVDAMTNGLAFVLRELLGRNGLAESDVKFVRAGGTPNRY